MCYFYYVLGSLPCRTNPWSEVRSEVRPVWSFVHVLLLLHTRQHRWKWGRDPKRRTGGDFAYSVMSWHPTRGHEFRIQFLQFEPWVFTRHIIPSSFILTGLVRIWRTSLTLVSFNKTCFVLVTRNCFWWLYLTLAYLTINNYKLNLNEIWITKSSRMVSKCSNFDRLKARSMT